MKYTIFLIIALLFGSQIILAQNSVSSANLINHLNEFSKTSAVTGREKQAVAYIQSLFEKGELKKDKLGNLVMVIGSGFPKTLITAPLDEAGTE